ncbi:uncharacterized protein BDZ99DRAFT_39717 [Mytilinidion resinicola]|uniref:Uncharacterized protein n=1 Tax=Mytilinidion resinicola TaxID=574789 RepID=A0A6A6YJP4_9PEZI|nr:uncharacterized protein BDZ99DRAFT_39717 [Mytilinidion resinicola]KAF2808779.1 hypothetical protein BDZ99DRAFT_39717 [Mytilinidion resinicola]
MSPPESPRYGPRPTLLDVERHPYQTPVGQVPLDISDECAEDFRLALKAILSKISDTLNSLVLDKELDDRVICAVADARRSLKKVHHTYTATTDLNCSQGLSKLFKFQDRIAMVRHQYNVNSIRQRLHPSEKGILVELLRHQQEELSLAYSFQHEDARLRTLTDRPVGTDIQRERATLKTISNHIEEFSRNYTYQLAINLPSFDELERQPSSGMATLILRNLGVQSQLTAISRRRRYAFSQSGTAAMMSALIVAALCHWVYETAFPSGPEDSYLRYQLMRKLIPHLMGSLGKLSPRPPIFLPSFRPAY